MPCVPWHLGGDTLNVYGHLFKPDDRAAAIMEAALTGGGQ
jgi:hypothetical protein